MGHAGGVETGAMVEGRRIVVEGTVQGVGFRPWVYRLASDTGVTGRVRNDATGVTIDAFGTPAALEAFERGLRASPPPAARVRAVTSAAAHTQEMAGFEIVATETCGRAQVSIPADLATCDECLAEIRDPANRRYRYPFTNCTNCGPRFTIARAVPYDRPRTSMAVFTMCPACQREYDAPSDRRFHAQPNACPACGPRLVAVTADGAVAPGGDAVRVAAEALRAGCIVAIKGIGGFHLACDATDDAAVARLRARKHREEKPLAVMVASVDEAARVAIVDAGARRLLAGPERPIVLLDRRPESGLAAGIAPGNPQVGLVLPYSPLHHLLLADVGRPLVMTSGNVSDEPIATDNAGALSRLSGIADLFLLHDRAIVTAADDSVARVIAGAPVLLRRSRGYVPRAIPLAEAVERPVLAVGGLLKNTCCVLTGHDAFLGPHIGDLDHLSAYRAFEASVRRMVEFLGVTPEVVAYDLHPGYQSTWFAKQWRGVAHVGVQHHHAHVAAVMAEHLVHGTVIGVAYDGTGYGTDGAAWGGEILRVERDRMTRLATFRPIALAGGDAAVKAPWRIALALLDDAWNGPAPLERLRLFNAIGSRDVAVVRQMIAARLHTAPAHGVGRYFDAVGALVLGASRATFEGQVATALGAAADAAGHGLYPYDVQRDGRPWEIDLRPAVRAIVDDLWRHVAPEVIAARFHRTIGAATAEVVEAVARPGVREPVVLGGGCFQNALLVEDVMARLPGAEVLLPRQAPPGDGGLALGQAMVAHWSVSRGAKEA